MGRAMDKVLATSAWGYTPQYTKHRVRIGHPVHKNLEKECTSCCTTIALAFNLVNRYEVELIAFRVDTVVDPSSNGDIRNNALSSYKD
ncbi:MAG: hypothetical protein QXT92_03200 [Nitrososphaerota archaeon]